MSLSLCYIIGEFFAAVFIIVWGIYHYDLFKSKKCDHRFVSEYYLDPVDNRWKIHKICKKCGSVIPAHGKIVTKLGIEYNTNKY